MQNTSATEINRSAIPLESGCAIISGNGRSGSNRLLDILDLHPNTVCRNEVNEIPGGAFYGIGGELFELSATALQELQTAIQSGKSRRSSRDRADYYHKAFLKKPARKILLPLSKKKIRNTLHALNMMPNIHEWKIPKALANTSELNKSTLVLKLNSCPEWARALSKTESQPYIIHNIRNPNQYLRSWYNRFIRAGAGSSSFEENFNDIPEILAHFKQSGAERLRAPNLTNIVEAEIWRWRFINEQIMSISDVSQKYLLVKYDEVEHDPSGTADRVHKFIGLEMDVRARTKSVRMPNKLFSEKHKHKLDESLSGFLLDRVLEGSPLKPLFSKEQH